MLRRFAAASVLLALAACAGGGGSRSSLPDVAANPHQKIGKPYKINGVWYRPEHDPGYDRMGVASWYGPKFHGKLTANGEVFDMNRLTAAHPTLPLPSLVRVTNLDNGRQVVVRVNDRGPFASDRILDLSRAAADELGSRQAGLARVRVQYLGPGSMREAITRVGEPEAYRDGRYAMVKEPKVGAIPQTVETRIEEGGEFEGETVRGIAVVVAEAEEAVVEVPVAPAPEPEPQQYYVQIGAFTSPENAASASARLPRAVPISLSTDEQSSVPLHRLRIGPYEHEFPAREALRVAQKAGFPDAHIVSAR
ncbi:septal ring lytic transglycosylase RlpA family protein [Parvularcula oceani]|uniref:septal ring lytic transglycosylase RlpA family protein n=1 Tax=Parvularcula oceani TaxID=1247963 RepID=UPI0006923A71|nr:septal ring lytic transglycosylase RlpA family protein [Parvularcula oceani]